MKLWKEKACFVIPATSFLTKSDTNLSLSDLVLADMRNGSYVNAENTLKN